MGPKGHNYRLWYKRQYIIVKATIAFEVYTKLNDGASIDELSKKRLQIEDLDKTGGGDNTINSALLVDNIKLTNIAKVPEPDTLFGLLLTLGLASKCKRKN